MRNELFGSYEPNVKKFEYLGYEGDEEGIRAHGSSRGHGEHWGHEGSCCERGRYVCWGTGVSR